jgi:hypothetical protein
MYVPSWNVGSTTGIRRPPIIASEHFRFPMRLITDPGFPWIAEIPGFVPQRRCGSCHHGERTLPLSPSHVTGSGSWGSAFTGAPPWVALTPNDIRRRYSRHPFYNLSSLQKSLLLAPLAKSPGGLKACGQAVSADGESVGSQNFREPFHDVAGQRGLAQRGQGPSRIAARALELQSPQKATAFGFGSTRRTASGAGQFPWMSDRIRRVTVAAAQDVVLRRMIVGGDVHRRRPIGQNDLRLDAVLGERFARRFAHAPNLAPERFLAVGRVEHSHRRRADEVDNIVAWQRTAQVGMRHEPMQQQDFEPNIRSRQPRDDI